MVSGPPMAQAPGAQASGLADNVAGALCYSLGLITGILFLVLEPYSRNRNIRFHAFQSIFFSIASIIIWYAAFQILFMSFGFGFFFITMLIRLAFFILWIFIILKTYQGQKIMLPVIGPLAEKQAMA